MGLITAKKRNEVWLKKTFILARNIILDMLLGGLVLDGGGQAKLES
jgi:hypothetical protein